MGCIYHFQLWLFLGRPGIARLYKSFIFSFLRFHTSLCSGYTNLHSHHQWRRFLFSPNPQHFLFIICRLSDDGHYDWCDVLSHCSYDMPFSNNLWCWVCFMCILAICLSLEKCLLRSSDHFFDWDVWLFVYKAVWDICIFWRLIPCQPLPLQRFMVSGLMLNHY